MHSFMIERLTNGNRKDFLELDKEHTVNNIMGSGEILSAFNSNTRNKIRMSALDTSIQYCSELSINKGN